MKARLFAGILTLAMLLGAGSVALGQSLTDSDRVRLDFTIESHLRLQVIQTDIRIDDWQLEGEDSDTPHFTAVWDGGNQPHLEILSNVEHWTLLISVEDGHGGFLESGGFVTVALKHQDWSSPEYITFSRNWQGDATLVNELATGLGKHQFDVEYSLMAFLDQVRAGDYTVEIVYTVTG